MAEAWGLIQFTYKYKEAYHAHQPFYDYYIGNRITGFTNHWMTFSGEMMIALLVAAAAILFGTERRWKVWLVGAALLTAGALMESWTRSMWLGAFCGCLYLIWFRSPWALLSLPPMVALLLVANPFDLRERALSSFTPHGSMDSNLHRGRITRNWLEND